MTGRAICPLESRSEFLTCLLVLFVIWEACVMANASDQASNRVEQVLIITIPLTNGKSGSQDEVQLLFKLEDELIKAIEHFHFGEYDGNEIGEGTFTMFASGLSANKLFDIALPILAKYRLPPGCRAVKRYGKPRAKEERVTIGNGAAN
jgi:hypothetical protein